MPNRVLELLMRDNNRVLILDGPPKVCGRCNERPVRLDSDMVVGYETQRIQKDKDLINTVSPQLQISRPIDQTRLDGNKPERTVRVIVNFPWTMELLHMLRPGCEVYSPERSLELFNHSLEFFKLLERNLIVESSVGHSTIDQV